MAILLTTEIEVTMAAPHPGDCALYVSYDGDDVADANKRWAIVGQASGSRRRPKPKPY